MSPDSFTEGPQNPNIDLTQYLLGSTSVDTLVHSQQQALLHPSKQAKRYAGDHISLLSNVVDLKHLSATKALEWMNMEGYLKTVSGSVNSPTMWEDMLEDAKRRGLPVRQLATAYGIGPTYGNGIIELAPSLAEKSEGALGITTDLLLLAAAAGNELKRHIHPLAQTVPAFDAAVRIAEHFGIPAPNHQDLITRLRSLFPSDERTPTSLSASEALEDSDAWDKMTVPVYGVLKKTQVDIPYAAVDFVRKSYQAFGQLLADTNTAQKIAEIARRSDTIIPFRGIRRPSFGPWRKHTA